MQRRYYNSVSPETAVGNWQWHEGFPYESQLLYEGGDKNRPLLSDMGNKSALDFACGPGRMIRRMSKIFNKVDGCDISSSLLNEASNSLSDLISAKRTNLYLTNGENLGDASKNHYDFIYSTIALQHICVHSIRMNIFKCMAEALKPGGCITLQMACVDELGHTFRSHEHADWSEDRISAKGTNSDCDVTITNNTLSKVKSDFNSLFRDTKFWFYDLYELQNGIRHPEYWPTHWIFINAYKA